MELTKYILFLLLTHSITVSAHQNFHRVKTFGNVKVRFTTGFEYEEINKAWIIGELSYKLAKHLKYKDSIFLDFVHYYIEYCNPDYFVSFDNGAIRQAYDGAEKPYPLLKKEGIVIREVNRKFQVASTLQLVEYAINNIISVKALQRPLEYKKNYREWLIHSIDTTFTKQIVSQTPSKIVVDILASRIYRPGSDKNDCYGVSYYFQNNKFHVFYNECHQFEVTKDSVLVSVDDIFQFETMFSYDALVFDTDSTFYFAMRKWSPPLKSFTIENKSIDFYEPYYIQKISSNNVTINFDYYIKGKEVRVKNRTSIYRIDKKELIQDLDEILDK